MVASSLADPLTKFAQPRAVCLVLPAAVVDKSIADVLPALELATFSSMATFLLGYLHCGPNSAGHFVWTRDTIVPTLTISTASRMLSSFLPSARR